MEITNFSGIETEFIQRVHEIVWCTAATISRQQRPRSRILHPIWESALPNQEVVTGWVCTHRYSFKSKHLAHNPYVSLTYVTDPMKPVHVDCQTVWVDDMDEKRRVWALFKQTPEPLGFDPAAEFNSVDHDSFGLLKLIPWRIALVDFPAESHDAGQRIWRNMISEE